ncbi:MAG TPA: glycine--tRNA ligase subunit beta, partial [Xanthomonadales bacterium]|nr:glycine--tRNA ligase subunit beta [Xanthomonadales bacterium]
MGEQKTPDTEQLLIELGCEELPPKALDDLRIALFSAVCAGLKQEKITFDEPGSQAFSTPRRLALLLADVNAQQEDQDQERRGPALKAAFDAEGKPTGAAKGFARSVGLEVDQLETVETDKGSWLAANVHIPGKPLSELIFPILEQALKQLPVPRPMRWSDHEFSFVRPVHWLVVMYGKDTLPGSLFGLQANKLTRGHRIHAPGPHRLAHAGEYQDVLKKAFLVADQEERSSLIAKALIDADPLTRIDEGLLAEVNNLVEWPVAVVCSFDEAFLAVPHEALVASMQDHQKFFPVNAGPDSVAVSNRFIVISNIESTQPDEVREGFERVVRPRLADARFFLEQDQLHPLEHYLSALNAVVFQQKIGSIGDKSKRMAAISKNIASKLSFNEAICERAARLSKCDLVSQMVGEFPELQGTMGHYYALHGGEPAELAEAIAEHYQPRFAGDAIPASPAGQIVGLADRCDSVVGIFAAGLRPTGNKDPFALRRSALGLIRILLEAELDLPLDRLLALAANQLTEQGMTVEPAVLADVREFITERARSHFRETGFETEVVSAALSSDWDSFPDLHARLNALNEFLDNDSGRSLAAANKRIGNILKKS